MRSADRRRLSVAGAALLLVLGTTTADAMPTRIVSLAPSVTETLFALGAGERVVAVSTFCDHPAEAVALPKIGSFLTPSVEAVVGMHPDLVIGMPSPGNRDAVLSLRRMGIEVLIVDVSRLDDLGPVVQRIAAAVGIPEAGTDLVRKMDAEMASVRRRLADARTPRVLMVVDQNPLIAVGPASFIGDLLAAAHATNVAPAGEAWPHLNVEHVIAADPEIVIDCSMGTDAGRDSGAFWGRFTSLTAVKTGEVRSFRSLRILRPGPGLPAALTELARLIHPDRWP